MEKVIQIDGKEIKFKSSGATPMLYRKKFGKDLLLGMQKLNDSFVSQNYDNGSLEVFENICYIMAKQADSTITENVDEWYDGFDMFSIYEVMPQIIDLWNSSSKVNIESKKNNDQVSAE